MYQSRDYNVTPATEFYMGDSLIIAVHPMQNALQDKSIRIET